ncbi:MAG TPA: hypothetical protein VGM88_04310 [Kofleriaceae bacterium]|jgi:hypothetical protein
MSITAIWVYAPTTITCSATVLDINANPVSPAPGTSTYSLVAGLYATNYAATITIVSGDAELQRVDDKHKTTPWPTPPRAPKMMSDVGITQDQVDALLGSTGVRQDARRPA